MILVEGPFDWYKPCRILHFCKVAPPPAWSEKKTGAAICKCLGFCPGGATFMLCCLNHWPRRVWLACVCVLTLMWLPHHLMMHIVLMKALLPSLSCVRSLAHVFWLIYFQAPLNLARTGSNLGQAFCYLFLLSASSTSITCVRILAIACLLFHFKFHFPCLILYFIHFPKIIKNSRSIQIEFSFFPHSCFDL